jgi:hypothetical protein
MIARIIGTASRANHNRDLLSDLLCLFELISQLIRRDTDCAMVLKVPGN